MNLSLPSPDPKPSESARVRTLHVCMTPQELQQFKGRCAIRIGDVGEDTGKALSPETRGALVEHGGGLVRVSERVGLFGRMLGL